MKDSSRSMMASFVATTLILMTFLSVASVSIGQADAATTVYQVSITSGSSSKTTDAYSPNPIAINAGDTVVWKNNDLQPHTVTSGINGQPDGNFDSSPNFNPLMAPGGTYQRTFNSEGTFPYYCGLHPNMVGTLTVQEADQEEQESISLTVKTDKSTYTVGDTVKISGKLKITGGEMTQPILIQVIDPSGQRDRIDQVEPSSSGSFSYSFIIEDDSSINTEGLYTVMVSYKTAEAKTTFSFTLEDSDNTISWSLDKSTYTVGDTVQLSGRVANDDNYVTVKITNPLGTVYRADQFRPESNGDFEYSFTVNGANAVEGSWMIVIKYESGQSIAMFVLENVGGNDEMPIQMDGLSLQDISGKPISGNLRIGQQVMLVLDAANNGSGPQQYVALLQISDEDGSTIYITWQSGTSNTGDDLSSGFAWASERSGTYTAKALIWTSLGNPVPLSDPAELDLQVR